MQTTTTVAKTVKTSTEADIFRRFTLGRALLPDAGKLPPTFVGEDMMRAVMDEAVRQKHCNPGIVIYRMLRERFGDL